MEYITKKGLAGAIILLVITALSAGCNHKAYVQTEANKAAITKEETTYIVRVVNPDGRFKKFLIDFYNKNNQATTNKQYRVFKEGEYRYINYDNERFFIEWETAPTLNADICCLFNNEFVDSAYGGSMAMSIPAIMFVNAQGEVVQYGLIRSGVSQYYESRVLKTLDSINTHGKFKPGMINGEPVSVVYKLLLKYGFYSCSSIWPFSPMPKSVTIAADSCGGNNGPWQK